ncbi:MAG: peptidase M23b [Candidatus Taylorbacteria bacterium]|nr:peptidase M23b [Candidatus Taylorbacteria bacterium]
MRSRSSNFFSGPARRFIAAGFAALVAGICFSCMLQPSISHADTIDDLKAKISDRNNNITQLEAEIKEYQVQIESLGKKSNTLKNTLAELDLSNKKLAADIKVTKNRIEATNLDIERLRIDIGAKQNNIEDDRVIIAQSMNKLYESDSGTIIEIVLREKSLSNALTSIEHLAFLQDGVRDRIQKLKTVKKSLESNKQQTERRKAELVVLNDQLKSQKKIIEGTAAEKNALLAQTKNTEANYKKTLADKQAKKDALESEISQLESQLRIAIDPKSIPHTGTGILAWPLANVRITQYFGNTPFATLNPQIYNGKGHTGVDFGTSIGTTIKAALAGTVVGVANTDLSAGCYSFGKWIMVKHANGLSTLYAHLSLQSVSIGDEVATGQTIGYSGNTGYSTGPHLHFGVYATQGVRITKMTSKETKNCIGATIPLADPKAYLNPLSYL